MREGWLNDDYLILFADAELANISERYAIGESLPGFTILGLRGWDDFIVRDPSGNTYTVPTVPLDQRYLQAFGLPELATLEADDRFKETIKWYITPLIFGGNPNDPKNLTWVNREQHIQLVIWWNNRYRSQMKTSG